jgi:uncharacterized protein (DUF342 family)
MAEYVLWRYRDRRYIIESGMNPQDVKPQGEARGVKDGGDQSANGTTSSVYVRNGDFSVLVSSDGMKAGLTLTPAIGGGQAVTADEILEECRNQRIVFGLNEQAIRKAVQESEHSQEVIRDVVVAEGDPPIGGEDEKLELQVQLATGARAKEREDGSVDFKIQDLYTQVRKGELLAILSKATPGKKNGRTVRGVEVKAGSGKSLTVRIGDNIRIEEKLTSTHYFSEIDGLLKAGRANLSVNPVLVIEGDVGPETGNIEFKGAVLVRGNVLDTYEISAGQGIIVEGNVRNAILRSSGDIEVHNGVLGKNKGQVIAKGNVIVKFAENANIQAGGNIVIQKAAMNSRLSAGDRIISVENRGQIIGGELKAKHGAEVKVLGNELDQKTEISLGSDVDLRKRIKDAQQKLGDQREALDKILLFLEKLKRVAQDPEKLNEDLKAKYRRAMEMKDKLEKSIAIVKKNVDSDVEELDRPMDAHLVVHNTLYRGVRVSFGNSHYEPESEQRGVRISFDRKNLEIKVDNDIPKLEKQSPARKRRDEPSGLLEPRKETGRL